MGAPGLQEDSPSSTAQGNFPGDGTHAYCHMWLLGEIVLLVAPVVGTWKPIPVPSLDLPYVSLILMSNLQTVTSDVEAAWSMILCGSLRWPETQGKVHTGLSLLHQCSRTGEISLGPLVFPGPDLAPPASAQPQYPSPFFLM